MYNRNDLIVIPKHFDSGLAFIKQVTKWGFLLDGVIGAAPGINGRTWYLDPIDGSYVYYIEEQIMGVAFYGSSGPRNSESIELIRSIISCWTDEEIFHWWDQAYAQNDIDGMVDSVIRLGLTAPVEHGISWSSRILAACHSTDSDVRNAAVVAIGVRMWSVFRSEISALAESDPDDILRQRAELLKRFWPE